MTSHLRAVVSRSPRLISVATAAAGWIPTRQRLRSLPADSRWTASAWRQVRPGGTHRAAVIVTASDSSHARSLLNLLASLAAHEPTTPVSVWDLGLSEQERRDLKASFPRARVTPFPYDQHPDYFRITDNAGQYAWKPVIIEDEVARAGTRIVIWLDAGDLVDRRLTWLRRLAHARGLYSPRSPGTVRQWTHPGTLATLAAGDDVLALPNLNGAIIAVDAENPRARDLVTRWSHCAQDRDCIAPEGSDRTNHRQDQAVLTVLAHQSGLAPRGACSELSDLLGVSTHRDVD